MVDDSAHDDAIDDFQTIVLPEKVNFRAADDLAEFLEGLVQTSVLIDASQVTFFGAIGLEVLVAAKEQWAQDNAKFLISMPSDAFSESLELLGLPIDYFEVENA